MSLKIASNKLEQLCTVQDLLVFEYKTGFRHVVIPVITEHTKGGIDIDPNGDYEFFRARAAHPGVNRSSFHIWHNQVSVTLCHKTKQMKVGPTGQLIMNKQGIGLGPALMACVLTWLKNQNVDHYMIDPGSLSSVDADTTSAREQRNRFYMAFGFVLSNWDGSKNGLDVVEGSFTAANVGELYVPERYQGRLKPWFSFERDLQIERECGVYNLIELKDIDTWTHSLTWFGRWLLRMWRWPVPFSTRHKHKRASWEPK